MTDFSQRLAKVPPKIMEMARATTWSDAPLSEVLHTAEMLMRRLAGSALSEDRPLIQPFLTAREARIILEALVGHETVFEDDVAVLRKLQEWFKGALDGRG